jgi:hypothetical protein
MAQTLHTCMMGKNNCKSICLLSKTRATKSIFMDVLVQLYINVKKVAIIGRIAQVVD